MTLNLLEFFEDVTSGVIEGELVDVVYLDFPNAFDKFPHKRLAFTIKAYGIGGSVLRWLEN